MKKYNFVSEFFTYKTLVQFVRFLATGLMTAGVEYLIFYFLLNVFKTWYIPSNVSMAAGFLFSFTINRLWSFQSRKNLARQLILYSTLFAFNLGAHNAIMYFLSDMMNIMPLISKVFVMGIIAMWNFVVFKKIIYR